MALRRTAWTTAALSALALSALALSTAAPAQAHLRSGTVAVDYGVAVTNPRTAAYRAQIYVSDRGLKLTLVRGHTVTVLGYLGEPVFRLDPSGLWINAASPTAVVAGLIPKREQVTMPAPSWRLEPHKTSANWHDARAQGLPAGIAYAQWQVPLVVDGRRSQLGGTLYRYPAPALWPWIIALLALVALSAAPRLAAPQDRRARAAGLATALALLASIASVLAAFGFALDTYGSPGTWIEALDELVFFGVGAILIRRGAENLRMPAAIGLGLLALGVGISKGAVFLHPIALAVLPATLTRVAVVTAIGAGLAASGLGAEFYAGAGLRPADADRSRTRPPRAGRPASTASPPPRADPRAER